MIYSAERNTLVHKIGQMNIVIAKKVGNLASQYGIGASNTCN